MKTRRFTPASTKTRRGFTLIELLVVISIIAVLMSLILPAIQNAREAGRRTECLNNQKNLCLAMMNAATAKKGQLPSYGYFPADGSGNFFNGRSWVVELLPYLDRQDIADRWNDSLAYDVPDDPANRIVNVQMGSTYLQVLACPNDDSAFQTPGGLSYVVNAGFGDADAYAPADRNSAMAQSPLTEPIDWNGNGIVGGPTMTVGGMNDLTIHDLDDEKLTAAMGVFTPEYGGVSRSRNGSVNIGKIYDGAGNTIMMTENINAGVGSWANGTARSCAFFLPIIPPAQQQAAGFFENTNDGPTPDDPSVAAQAFAAANGPAFINKGKAGPEGQRPIPNGLHPGILVVGWCDGSVDTLSEDIDRSVYVRLITSSGSRLRAGYGTETPLSETDF